jgi:hypothetical protein
MVTWKHRGVNPSLSTVREMRGGVHRIDLRKNRAERESVIRSNEIQSWRARGLDAIMCQLCLVKKATRRLTERSSTGRAEEAKYCEECYEAKYVDPHPRRSTFPRPRFTIKAILILVCFCAVVNAVTALVMRSGFITGTMGSVRFGAAAGNVATLQVLPARRRNLSRSESRH